MKKHKHVHHKIDHNYYFEELLKRWILYNKKKHHHLDKILKIRKLNVSFKFGI